jgi:ParB/RepB/Spo0J family partition protein
MATEVPVSGSGKPLMVYPSQLVERKANNRFDFGNLTELMESIQTHGILQPLHVKKLKDKVDGYDAYEVTIGNRRTRAVKRLTEKLGEETQCVPVIVEPATITERERIVKSLTTDIHGLNRTMLEVAHDVQALIADGAKQKEIAKMINKSAQYVSDCVLLMEKGNDSLFKQIRSGQVTPYSVIEMLKAGKAPESVSASVEKLQVKKEAAKKEAEASGKTASKKQTVGKTELAEESGVAIKGKKAASYGTERSVAAAGTDDVVKESKDVIKLRELMTAMKANQGGKKKIGFGMLTGIISFLTGKAQMPDMIPLFFWDFDTDIDKVLIEDVAKFQSGDAALASEPAPKKGAKKAAAEDDLEEDTPTSKKAAKTAKPTKGATTLKDKKAAAKKKAAVEDEVEPEEVEDIDLSDDEDFEE